MHDDCRYYRLCPVGWTLYGITVTQLGDVTSLMQLDSGGQVVPLLRWYHTQTACVAGRTGELRGMRHIWLAFANLKHAVGLCQMLCRRNCLIA